MKKTLTIVLMLVLAFSLTLTLEAKKQKKTYLVDYKLEKVTVDNGRETRVDVKDGKSFADGMIAIKWKPSPKGIKFEMENKSGVPLSIVWDECYYLDRKEERHGVVYSGLKLRDKDKKKPPLQVPANKKIKNSVFPSGLVFEKSKMEVGKDPSTGAIQYTTPTFTWDKKPIFEKKIKLNEESDFDFEAFKQELEKGKIGILLFLTKGKKHLKYYFDFKARVVEK